MHIAQPVASDRIIEQSNRGQDYLPQWLRIILITEFVPNLSLHDVLERQQMSRALHGAPPMPNRVIWMIYRCFALALANSPMGKFGLDTKDPALENPPATEPSNNDRQIFHGNMDNLENFIFGELDADDHSLVPILKLTDFGEATDDFTEMRIPSGMTATTITSANIYEIGRVMQRVFNNFPYPNLDLELYNLSVRCVQLDHDGRPALLELFDRVQTAIATKTGPEHFREKPFADRESNENIMNYIQDMIYSAEYLYESVEMAGEEDDGEYSVGKSSTTSIDSARMVFTVIMMAIWAMSVLGILWAWVQFLAYGLNFSVFLFISSYSLAMFITCSWWLWARRLRGLALSFPEGP
ncbi:hypothetical protein F5X99DRAFT_406653 [Biscogniauxia marginata]|nr:hypothetical protein F5X99DRAFT_406653 [Biscogniauxia marginata]